MKILKLPFTAISSFFLIFFYSTIFSYALSLSKSDSNIDRSWHISALKVSYDDQNKIYTADGDVVITGMKKSENVNENQADIRLEAQYVEFSNITRDAVAFGNVLLISGKDSITCDRLKLNFETEKGTIYNGVVFIEENNFYIKGDTIEKIGKDSYYADKASVTSCDGENPDWKLSGKDIKITIDGYGTAKNATFWAGKIPALYSPIILFPAKTKRQTGFLTPQFSSSEKKGFEIEEPVFIAASQSTDATIYTDYMSKRGTKTALEFRYILSKDNFGTLFYDYLKDDQVDNISSGLIDYDSITSNSNNNRYWFRMKNSHIFDDKWQARLDIDYVSDSDYLHEFRDGFTGFDTISRYFRDTFGRSIDEYDDTTRENSFNINRTWKSSSLNIGAEWFDNVDAKNSKIDSNIGRYEYKDNTLQKLPFIEFNTIKQPFAKTPFYYDFNSNYRYFYRQSSYKDGYLGYYPLDHYVNSCNHNSVDPQIADFKSIADFTDIKPMFNGHRADIFPKVYMPFQFGAFSLEPSAGFRQTLWYIDDNEFNDISMAEDINSIENNNFSHREMFDFNFELSTKLSKVFNTDTKNSGLKIKHDIIPKVKYSFTKNLNEYDYKYQDKSNTKLSDTPPYFDPIDYIKEKNYVTLALGNILTSRNKNSFYNEVAWIEISQSYRLNTTESNTLIKSDDILNSNIFLNSNYPLNSNDLLNLNNFLNYLNPLNSTIFDNSNWIDLSDLINIEEYSFKHGKQFSDILTEIEFSPNQFFSLNSDIKWSPYSNCFISHDSGMTIKDRRGDTLQAFYRYQDSQLEHALSNYEALLSQFFSSELSPTLLSQTAASQSLFTSVNTQLTDSFSIFFILEHDLKSNETVESHTGFYFNRPCWAMRIAYSDRPEDQSLSFMVNLNGIGEFGKR